LLTILTNNLQLLLEKVLLMQGPIIVRNNLRSVPIDLELRALEAYKSRIIEFYRYCLADDRLTVPSFSVVDKEIALRGIAMNSSQVLGYSMDSPRLIFLTTGSAIMFYKPTLESQKEGRRLILPVFASTAYVHIGGTSMQHPTSTLLFNSAPED
jgi:hypothetical protein